MLDQWFRSGDVFDQLTRCWNASQFWKRTLSKSAARRRKNRNQEDLSGEKLEQRQLLTVVSLTDHEQLMLEFVNRARANPQAEASRFGLPGSAVPSSAVAPLAPNQSLVNAARSHSQAMLDFNFFAHNNPITGSTPGARASAAGYNPIFNIAENIAWNGTTGDVNQTDAALTNYENLLRSAGHRENIFGTEYAEIGVGSRVGEFDGFNAAMVTQKFGNRGGLSFITGVVFTDNVVDDDFYTVGESVPGATITITGPGVNTSEITGTSGAYAISVPNGTYTVTLSGPNIGPQSVSQVTVAGTNQKVDFQTSESGGGTPGTLNLQIAPRSFPEDAGTSAAVGLVTRTGDTSQQLVVTLSSNDTTEATVPSTVTIPAGQTTVQFFVNAIDDTEPDGSRTVTITASAANIPNELTTVTVTDASFTPTGPSGTINEVRPTFTWPVVTGASRYELWLRNETTGQNPFLRNREIRSTSFTPDIDLPVGDYRFFIRSFNSDGVTGELSNPLDFTVLADSSRNAPDVTSPAAGSFTSSARPTVTWQGVSSAATYEINFDNISLGQNAVLRVDNISGTTFTPTADLPSAIYDVQVRGISANGVAGDWSEKQRFNVAPLLQSATGGVDSASPQFTWDGVDGSTQYDLWVNNSTTGQRQVIRNSRLTTTSFASTGRLDPGTYDAYIRAFSGVRQPGPWSEKFTFTVTDAPVVTGPTGNSAESRPFITWEAFAGATSFDVRVHNAAGEELFLQRGVQALSLRSPIVLPEGQYTASVRAIDQLGDATDWSLGVTFSQVSGPQFTSPPSGTLTEQPVFSWSDIGDAQFYDLWVNNKTTGERQVIRESRIEDTTFAPTNALPAGEYQAFVRSIIAKGETSAWSDPVTFTIADSAVPTVPTVRLPEADSSTPDATPTFAWTGIPGAARYDLLVNNSKTGQVNVIRQASLAATEFTPPVDLPSATYEVLVRGIFANNVLGDWSEPVTFDIAPRLRAVTGGASSRTPQFAWTGVSGSSRYDLWVNDLTTGERQVIRNTRLTGNMFVSSTELAPGDYRAFLRAFSDEGAGPWSPSIDFTVSNGPNVTSPTGATNQRQPLIEWDALTGAVSYNVRVQAPDTGDVLFLETGVTATSLQSPIALPLGEYLASVQGVDSTGGTSAWSLGVGFAVTNTPILTSPTGTIDTTLPTFQWTPITGTTRYDLWVNNRTTGERQVIRNTRITDSQFTAPSPLTPGVYQAFVRAFDQDVQPSAFSAPVTFTVASDATATTGATSNSGTDTNDDDTGAGDDTGATGDTGSNGSTDDTATDTGTDNTGTTSFAPTFTEPTLNSNGGVLSLNWEVVSGIERYELEIASLSQLIQEPNLRTATYDLSPDLPNGNYRARVRVVDSNGTVSAWSPVLEFAVIAESTGTTGSGDTSTGTSLTATEILSPTSVSFSTRPTFRWTRLDGVSTYELAVTSVASGEEQSLEISITDTPEFTVPVSFPLGDYQARMRGIAADGTAGPWSESVSFAVAGIPNITSPGDTTTDATPTIGWTSISGATEYEILFRSHTGQNIEINERGITVAAITPTSDLPLGAYSVAVRAFNADGEASAWSEPHFFSIEAV